MKNKLNTPILVTGATGNLGKALLACCKKRSIPCVGAVRRIKDDTTYPQVLLDFQKSETFEPALEGVQSVFLVRPPAIAKVTTTINPFLDVAAQTGIKHVVFVSVSGAENNSMVPHHGIEQHLLHGTLPYTLLRPGFFAQNLEGAYRSDIRDDDRIYLPTGKAQGSLIDTRDIAEAACNILQDPENHLGQAYTLTGQSLVSFEEVATILSEELERTIRYQPCSLWSYFWHVKRRHKLPWMQCVVQALLHAQFARGGAAKMDPKLPELLGHPPTTLREYIQDHKDLWK
ncbi:MAG: SDR family NAD(P)-dependent oxidoreductase [Deltaproteobacteria bacterium]|nr:MAG: SDR family NAD(P)-dependent oxidoreductase [Deltaproteobacteria bacterium]